jgi:hypothetical protein
VRHLRLALAVVALLSAYSAAVAAPARAASKVSILDQDAIEVAATRGNDTAATHLSVLNTGDELVTLTLSLQAVSTGAVGVEHRSETVSVPPGKARRIRVTLNGLKDLRDKVTGQFVLTGGAEPVAKGVSVLPASTHDWPLIMLIAAVAAAVALMAYTIGWALTRGKGGDLFNEAPGPKWKFDDSWATSLTAIGALLGTVVGSSALPEIPHEIDKDTATLLSLGFGGAVVSAPFIFSAVRNPTKDTTDPDAGRWGYNFALLLSCSITFGAVVGELATLGLVSWELIDPKAWRYAALGAFILLGELSLYYFLTTVPYLATSDWEKKRQAVIAGFQAELATTPAPAIVAPPAAQRWHLP